MSSNWRKHVVWSPLDRQRLMFRLLSCVTGACRHRGTVFIRAPDSHFRSRDKKTVLQDKPVIRLRAICWEGGSDLNLRGSVSQRVFVAERRTGAAFAFQLAFGTVDTCTPTPSPAPTLQPLSFNLSPASLCRSSSKSGKSTYADDSVPYSEKVHQMFKKELTIHNSFQMIISTKYIRGMAPLKWNISPICFSPRCQCRPQWLFPLSM